MDKGLASRRARQHKAVHERKWRSSAFYNPKWGGPTHVDEEGNPDFGDGSGGEQFGTQTLKLGADPDFLSNNQKTKKPGKPGVIVPPPGDKTPPDQKGPPVVTGEGGAAAAGQIADAAGASAAAAKEAADAMKKAADEAKKEKDSLDGMAKATGDVKTALTDNATAQQANTAAVKDLVNTAGAALIKNGSDIKSLTDTVKKLVADLKAAGLLK
jgi:hypothetical protein